MILRVALRDVSSKTKKGNIKIAIHIKGLYDSYISTPYYIEPIFFDSKNEIVKKEFPESTKYNAGILNQKNRYEQYYKDLGDSISNVSPQTLKKLFETYDKISYQAGKPTKSINDFIGVINKIIYDLENEETSDNLKRDGYASTFKATRGLMIDFFKSESILFQNIDNYALIELKKYFLKNRGKEVTFNKHLRNIRKVFNVAIGQNFISQNIYPFKSISIPSDYESEIRCLEIKTIQKLYKKNSIGRDFFFISFFLCGMNMKDIYYMPYFREYLDTKRLKTARTTRKVQLKLKLQPELIEILNNYPDPEHLHLIKTEYSNHRTLTHFIGRNLKETIDEINKELPEQDKLPYFTFAYARHSWATIAGSLRISDDVIDKAQMRSVTGKMIERYRKYDFTQVDEANRKVIDYVLHEKK